MALTDTEKAFFLKLTRAGGWKFPGSSKHQEELFEEALDFIRDRHVVAAPPPAQTAVRGTTIATFRMSRTRTAIQASSGTPMVAADGGWALSPAAAAMGFATRVVGGSARAFELEVPVTRPSHAFGFAVVGGYGDTRTLVPYNANGNIMPWFGGGNEYAGGPASMLVPISATERLALKATSTASPQYLSVYGGGTALSRINSRNPFIEVYLAVN